MLYAFINCFSFETSCIANPSSSINAKSVYAITVNHKSSFMLALIHQKNQICFSSVPYVTKPCQEFFEGKLDVFLKVLLLQFNLI